MCHTYSVHIHTKMKIQAFLIIFASLARGSVQGTWPFDQIENGTNHMFESIANNLASARNYISALWTVPDEEAALHDPDMVLSVPGMIARHGYPCETHTVLSQGYVLNVHRIPHGRHNRTVTSKTVLLQHGLFASSVDWILNGPDKSLAYVLADAGYDVWMSNIRGNKYSREHISLKTDSARYWNFSWHEVAQHDVPAIIDYIKERKGPDARLAYMGHSMGTTILFAMLTLRPEYNRVLEAGFALGPIAYFTHIKSPIKDLAPVIAGPNWINMIDKTEFNPKQSQLKLGLPGCSAASLDTYVCKNAVFYICGANEKQFNKALLPVFLTHLGTGTSWKTILHFAQEINADGRFQKFDYGPDRNMKEYGSEIPPEYDLSKITLPISLFYSQNDLLSNERDVHKLYQNLGSKKEMYLVPDPEFNHVDYLMANDAPRLLNNKVLENLDRAFNRRTNKLRRHYMGRTIADSHWYPLRLLTVRI